MIDPLSKWMYKRSGPLAGSLTFLGLSMAWFSAFLYVCWKSGVPSMEMPSRLFALGSVYGMQRPTLEVAWQTTCAGLFGVLAPVAIYKGTVFEYHKADKLAGRPEKKFM